MESTVVIEEHLACVAGGRVGKVFGVALVTDFLNFVGLSLFIFLHHFVSVRAPHEFFRSLAAKFLRGSLFPLEIAASMQFSFDNLLEEILILGEQ